MSWTNNDQALSSPINATERDERGWFVLMEDTRRNTAARTCNVFSIWTSSSEAPRGTGSIRLKKIKETTGLNGYLFDSFYNLGFMPINYRGGKPTTQWRELLLAFKELQDAGIISSSNPSAPSAARSTAAPRSTPAAASLRLL